MVRMQNLPLYQVDAFSAQLFGGNPAAVVPLPSFLPTKVMQQIAAENNLSETAFVVVRGPGKFDIRWFTPSREVRLCGHATLAAAHIMFHSGGEQFEKMSFRTQKVGNIIVTVNNNGSYAMDFPIDKPKKVKPPKSLKGILGGLEPLEVYRGIDDLMVVLKNQKQVKSLSPNFPMLAALKKLRGLVVTAEGKNHDFISRGFFPTHGINEDPVTGSAHTLLTPYWAKKLKKKRMSARQISSCA